MSAVTVLLPLLLLATASRASPLFSGLNVDKIEPSDDKINYRLPDTVKPIHYRIHLEPQLADDFKFNGSSEIDIKVLQKTRTLTLHSLDLEIGKTISLQYTTTNKDGKQEVKTIPAKSHTTDPVREFLIIEFGEDLEVKTYTLHLSFSGSLIRNDKRGFYRSSYLTPQGEKIWLAVTHFEPTGARLAFPCWDEPSYKAMFSISIKAKYNAISNANGTSVTKDGYTTTVFKPTEEMSTYLVAFVVSDYVGVIDEKDNTYRVWTKKHAVDSAKYALNTGKDVISALDTYTGIAYKEHMEKIDQVSVPDFAPSAMENWGLVTYAEKALLYTQGVTTTARKQSITTVIAHEFAHQWFGNLVTPTWWTYLWLNEGFATYFQYLITDQIKITWRLMDQFVVKDMQATAFEKDFMDNTHPINHQVNSPIEIKGTFDAIAYQKAGSIIRMMSHILTEKVFRAGLKNYLSKFSLKNASPEDLLDALQAAADASNIFPDGFRLKVIMDEWLNKPGYPVVHVKRNKENGDLILNQERFCEEAGDQTKWWIPINYVTEENLDFSNTKATHWLTSNGSQLIIPGTNSSTFVLLNKYQTGFYRVNYDAENWELQTKFLMSNKYHDIVPVNRAQLVDDAFSLARLGKLNYSTALRLSNYLAKETDYIPWVPVFRHLNFLSTMLCSSGKYNSLKQYFAQQMENIIKLIQFVPLAEESHFTKLARPQVLKWACAMDHDGCTKHVEEKYSMWLKNPTKNALDVDLREHIMCAALSKADQKVLDATLKKYKEANAKSETKEQLLSALSCSTSKEFLKAQLQKTLEDKTGDEFDVFVLNIVKNSPAGIDVALDVIKENYTQIQEFDKDGNKMKAYLNQIGGKVNSATQFLKLGVLISSKKIETAQIDDAMRNAAKNLNWINNYSAAVTNWLDGYLLSQNNSAASLSFSLFLFIIPVLLARFY